jgi:chromosome partitioning protein
VTAAASSGATHGSSASPVTAKRNRRSKPQVPEIPGVARIIAIANQKGGVGKSTTAVSLGAALADLGYRVLVLDLDPQGNASTGMGIRHEAREVTVYDVVVAEAAIDEAIVATPVARLDAVPSTIDLAGAEIELVSQFSRESRLKRALEPVREGRYDYILLDCPPSLGLLTVNALTAAEELIVPIQCEYYALEGLGQLLRNVSLVQQNINQGLRLTGIVMTMFDPRTKLSEQVVAEVRRFFGELVYDVIIPRTVRLSEAPGFGQPITLYDPRSKGAEAYRELAREVAVRPAAPAASIPSMDELPTVVMPQADPPAAMAAEPEDELEPDQVPTVHDLESTNGSEPASVRSEPEVRQAEPVARVEAEDASMPEPEPEPASVPEPQRPPEQAAAATPAPLEDDDPFVEVAPPVEVARATPPRSTPPPMPDDWEEASEASVPEPRVRPVGRSTVPSPRVVVIDDAARTGGDAELDDGRGEAEIGATLHDDEGGKRRWRLFRKGGEE